jgi:hypothetical protein
VPQGRQPHVFLHRGLLAAERLLPGFGDDLLAVGAVPIDTAELAWLGEQGWGNRAIRSFEVLSTSRPVLEQPSAAGLSNSQECKSSADVR